MIPFSAVARATTGSRVVATNGFEITGSMTVARSRGLDSSAQGAVLTSREPAVGKFDAGQLNINAPDLCVDSDARPVALMRIDHRMDLCARVALMPSHSLHATEPGVSQQLASFLGRFDPDAQRAMSVRAF